MKIIWDIETNHDDCPQCDALIDPAINDPETREMSVRMIRGEEDHSILLIRTTSPARMPQL